MRMVLGKTDTLKLLAFGLGITSVACGHQARAFQKRNHQGGGRYNGKRTALDERRKVQLFEYLYWKPRFKREQAVNWLGKQRIYLTKFE